MTDEELRKARQVWPHLSGRQLRERKHACTGLALLIDDGCNVPNRYGWLYTDDENMRVSLLALLGRMFTDGQADIDDVRDLADELCKIRPNTKAALQRLRQHVGRRRESRRQHDGLAHRIAVAIDEWRVENPEATDGDVVAALERMLAVMRSG